MFFEGNGLSSILKILGSASSEAMIQHFSTLFKQELNLHECLFFLLDAENKKLDLIDKAASVYFKEGLSLSINDRENPICYSLLFSSHYKVKPSSHFPNRSSYYRHFHEVGKNLSALCIPIIMTGKPYGVFLLLAKAETLNHLQEEKVQALKATFLQAQYLLVEKESLQQELSQSTQKISELSALNYDIYIKDYIDTQWVDHTISASRVKRGLMQSSKSSLNMLLTGGKGAGKKHFSSIVHRITRFQHGECVIVNCLDFKYSLDLEIEIFGCLSDGDAEHQQNNYIGAIERAKNGTLFLENIDAMPASTRRKVYKSLLDKKFSSIGSGINIPIETRIVCSQKSRVIYQQLNKTDIHFYQSIGQITVDLVSINEAKDNILPLAEHFLTQYKLAHKRQVNILDYGVQQTLRDTHYVDGGEELKQVIFYAANKTPFNGSISSTSITEGLSWYKSSKNKGPVVLQKGLTEMLDDFGGKIIKESLMDNKGNLSLTAKKLGISRRTLTHKCMKLGIKRV